MKGLDKAEECEYCFSKDFNKDGVCLTCGMDKNGWRHNLEAIKVAQAVQEALAKQGEELVEKINNMPEYEYEDGFYRGMAETKDGGWIEKSEVIDLIKDSTKEKK